MHRTFTDLVTAQANVGRRVVEVRDVDRHELFQNMRGRIGDSHIDLMAARGFKVQQARVRNSDLQADLLESAARPFQQLECLRITGIGIIRREHPHDRAVRRVL